MIRIFFVFAALLLHLPAFNQAQIVINKGGFVVMNEGHKPFQCMLF
jgi:hypothetical protein